MIYDLKDIVFKFEDLKIKLVIARFPDCQICRI